jgi:hypothetical protein
MKKQNIRHGVFETNSSSTHSICIPKEDNLKFPDSVEFYGGEFGWEDDRLGSIEEKASYLYTGLACNGRHKDIVRIKNILEEKGVKVILGDSGGYVDHDDELSEFLDGVMSDEGKLLRFLFSPLAFILTGNDNDGSDVEINVSYEHDQYCKGN